MTLRAIATALAKNVGMAVPDVVISSPLRQWLEAAQFANEAGEELARRVDWGQLQETATLTGDGTALTHPVPSGFSRLGPGATVFAGTAIVRPLTRAEWNTLIMAEGPPRYFLLEGDTIRLWPYLAIAATATIQYQSKNWCSAGASFVADTDTVLIDEAIFTKALIVRWRRQKGMDYADFEAEYEAALQDFAKFNDRSRV